MPTQIRTKELLTKIDRLRKLLSTVELVEESFHNSFCYSLDEATRVIAREKLAEQRHGILSDFFNDGISMEEIAVAYEVDVDLIEDEIRCGARGFMRQR